jgi:hypothetical protein
MSAFKVKITGFREVGDHIEYSILVSDVLNGKTHEYSHRYSTLRQAYYSLKPFSRSLSFPKKKFFGNRGQKFLLKRKNELESFLSTAFSYPQMRNHLMSTIFFKVKCDVIEQKKEEMPKKEEVCKECTKMICWNVSNQVNDRLIDLSCHPGCLDESEVLSVQGGLLEKCKDFKVFVLGKKEDVDESWSQGKADASWIFKGFDGCLDVIRVKLLT